MANLSAQRETRGYYPNEPIYKLTKMQRMCLTFLVTYLLVQLDNTPAFPVK